MGWTLAFLICLVVAVHSIPQADLDELLEGVFETENRNPQTETQSKPAQSGNYRFEFHMNHKNIFEGKNKIFKKT